MDSSSPLNVTPCRQASPENLCAPLPALQRERPVNLPVAVVKALAIGDDHGDRRANANGESKRKVDVVKSAMLGDEGAPIGSTSSPMRAAARSSSVGKNLTGSRYPSSSGMMTDVAPSSHLALWSCRARQPKSEARAHSRQACYAPAMCGRFTQHLSWAELHRLTDLIGQPRNFGPRYNIAPTTRIEVIRPAGGNELVPMRWGLIPSR